MTQNKSTPEDYPHNRKPPKETKIFHQEIKLRLIILLINNSSPWNSMALWGAREVGAAMASAPDQTKICIAVILSPLYNLDQPHFSVVSKQFHQCCLGNVKDVCWWPEYFYLFHLRKIGKILQKHTQGSFYGKVKVEDLLLEFSSQWATVMAA